MMPASALCAFCTSEASASPPMKGFAMAASKPIFVRWSTATALVVSMSFNLMSAIDCSPKEWAILFIAEISDADSGRMIWKFILTAQTWCSTAQMVLAAISGSLCLSDGLGSRARTIGLFFSIAALAILSKKGLVIGLYQRVILCQPYHFKINVSVFIQPCQERWLIGPLTAVAQKWLLWLFFHRHVVKVGYGLIIICTHCST